MELLFRGIARAGGIEVPTEVRIFESAKGKPRKQGLSTRMAEALHLLPRTFDRLADYLAANAGSAGNRSVAP